MSKAMGNRRDGRPRTEWVMRAVVGEEKVPFDTDYHGNTLYTEFDVLECGHKVSRHRASLHSSRVETMGEGQHELSRYVKQERRRCKRCETEQETKGEEGDGGEGQ